MWWRWWESNPRPRHAGWRFFHRLGPFLEPPGGERTSRSGRLPPGFRLPSGGVAAAYLVPPSGRPKPPFRRFNEPATQRSRGLARNLGCPRQREPVRSYRWQFDVGGLMRGPAVQPPPAPDTRITTCRNRSPPCVAPRGVPPSRVRSARRLSMDGFPRPHKGARDFRWRTARLSPSAKRQGRARSSGVA